MPCDQLGPTLQFSPTSPLSKHPPPPQKYKAVGLLTGSFYDADGQPTALLLRAEALAGAPPEDARPAVAGLHTTDLQPCNSAWAPETGSEVWCDIGFPRKVVEPGQDGAHLHPVCVCQRSRDTSRSRRLFGSCTAEERRCAAPELDLDEATLQ